MLQARFKEPLHTTSPGLSGHIFQELSSFIQEQRRSIMKKFTLLKFLFVVATAVSLYCQATYCQPTSATTPPEACPSFCFHLICGNGQHAHCSNGRCVCP